MSKKDYEKGYIDGIRHVSIAGLFVIGVVLWAFIIVSGI